jgi:hypothetical protein
MQLKKKPPWQIPTTLLPLTYYPFSQKMAMAMYSFHLIPSQVLSQPYAPCERYLFFWWMDA